MTSAKYNKIWRILLRSLVPGLIVWGICWLGSALHVFYFDQIGDELNAMLYSIFYVTAFGSIYLSFFSILDLLIFYLIKTRSVKPLEI